MKKFKVFLSSPHSEFSNYRTRCINYFRNAAISTRFEIITSELNNGSEKNVVEFCLGKVNECNFFILLIGNTYGTIPDGLEMSVLNPKKLSITELEYDEAYKLHELGKMKLHIMEYKNLNNELNILHFDTEKKLTDFKKKLNRHTQVHFSSIEEFIEKISCWIHEINYPINVSEISSAKLHGCLEEIKMLKSRNMTYANEYWQDTCNKILRLQDELSQIINHELIDTNHDLYKDLKSHFSEHSIISKLDFEHKRRSLIKIQEHITNKFNVCR